jgi:mitochondrial fission protein ELM1
MKPLSIQILSDGKPGHENQSYGLAEAIGRRREVEVSKISLSEVKGGIARFRHAWKQSGLLPRPDLILGAGHAVHPAMLALARRNKVPCVVMMKPTLPCGLFDLCLVPEHDLGGKSPSGHVIPTLGALNRVPPANRDGRAGGIILLGGPSSSYGWDQAAVITAVKAIVEDGRSLKWLATDSRRSPEGTLSGIAAAVPGLEIHPHAGTGRNWLPEKLATASEAWVTEESISMIYEALSSGARVGLLPVPATKRAGRVARGIAKLAEAGFVTRFAEWSPRTGLTKAPRVLREADRCAEIVLERLIKR